MNRFLYKPTLFLRALQTATCLLVATLPAHAQQFDLCMELVATSGTSGIQGTRHLSWSIGEPFINTLSSSSYVLTQGFHQPDPCGKKFVATRDLADWGFSLFPNPSAGSLTLRFSAEKKGYLLATVSDLLGRPVLVSARFDNPEGNQIDASDWPPGVYFLTLQDPVSKASASFRFVRI